jgi:hypothetical protein
MEQASHIIGLISAVAAIAALLSASTANRFARDALAAQIGVKLFVRCRQGLDGRSPQSVAVVWAVAENVGGVPITIDQVSRVLLEPGMTGSPSTRVIPATEHDIGPDYPVPTFRYTLPPRQVLQVPIPEAWFRHEAELQRRAGVTEFLFRVVDTTGVYFDTPRMRVKCWRVDCPVWISAAERIPPVPWTLAAVRHRWQRHRRCR